MIRSSPAAWDALLFFGSGDGYLYGLEARSGELLWRYRTGSAIVAGPTVADGMLLVGSTDRRVHAFTLQPG